MEGQKLIMNLRKLFHDLSHDLIEAKRRKSPEEIDSIVISLRKVSDAIKDLERTRKYQR
jgi:flagellin-specific chaperone FliS